MSNTSPSSTPATSGRTQNDCLSFGLLREIRTDAQYLQNLFEETMGLAAKLDAAGRAALMERMLGDRMQARINYPIGRNLDAFEALFGADHVQREWGSDAIECIRLNWLQVMDLWPNAALTFDEQRQAIDQAQVCLDQIIYQCASLTLSPRVNDTMANLRVGQPLDFDFVFGSELPRNVEKRKRLLLELAQEGGVLASAVVDVDQGVIYKVAESRAEQRQSAYKLAAFLVLAGALVPLVLVWGSTQSNQLPFAWPDLPRLYMLYVVVFLGAGAHVAIDSLKAAKAKTRPDFQAMNDWVLWVHVHYISILWGLGWVLLGYILLIFAMPKLELLSAFFAGYSIDSITALFLTRFETTVKTNTQALTGVQSTP
ncbi:MAG TPA: hypothetical protein VHR36_13605 [Pyrinomonadaceae bacterium]|jgi:hypothetical protein|nr:hypothetical protein [Pyrinomonadaceae bacterium]